MFFAISEELGYFNMVLIKHSIHPFFCNSFTVVILGLLLVMKHTPIIFLRNVFTKG